MVHLLDSNGAHVRTCDNIVDALFAMNVLRPADALWAFSPDGRLLAHKPWTVEEEAPTYKSIAS